MNRCTGVIIVAAAVASAVPAGAQQIQAPPRVERLYRGLFGGGVGDAQQVLTFRASLGGGYDDNVLAGGQGGATPAAGGTGGGFAAVSGDLGYSLDRSRVGLSGSIASVGRYYPDYEEFVGSHSGSIGTYFQLARSTRLTASHITTYQPYLSLRLFPQLFDIPGEAVPTQAEVGIERTDYFSHNSSLSVSQGLGKRQTLSFAYGYRRDDFHGDESRNLSGHSASGRWTLGLRKGLNAYLGYGRTNARYRTVDGAPVAGHNIDAGLDLNKALSFSRRTTFTFGSGSVILADEQRKHYRITGRAALNHEIGRSWNATLAYARNAGFIEAFGEPVFSDSVNVGVGGMISRRLQFQSGVSAALGELAFTGEGSGFDTYSGTARVTYGLTRYLGLSLSYAYYRYSFDQGIPLPEGYSREMSRNSVQATLSVWAPLFHRARRPDASR